MPGTSSLTATGSAPLGGLPRSGPLHPLGAPRGGSYSGSGVSPTPPASSNSGRSARHCRCRAGSDVGQESVRRCVRHQRQKRRGGGNGGGLLQMPVERCVVISRDLPDGGSGGGRRRPCRRRRGRERHGGGEGAERADVADVQVPKQSFYWSLSG